MTIQTAPDDALPGVHPSPNIQSAPDVYEIENRAADPDGRVEAAMASIAPWQGKVVLDLGAGTGFHVPRFHALARHVVAVEPHAASRLRAMARVAGLGLERASVVMGSAEAIPLPDASVDVTHARFAYFFGPGCEPGLAELERVMRPGGTAFGIDNDLRTGTFAHWLRQDPNWAGIDPTALESFWAGQGFKQHRVASIWRFERREDLEAVVRLEFPAPLAERILDEHHDLAVDYHFNLFYRRYAA
ncbi:MAG: class I SAM-dependent methyltransferase [Chloroflexota bacterium]|nr:class I SAM-dependent methyltransferase [Chloroflexota bacterium]